MGTNFYAKIIPSEFQKETLKRAIDENRFNEIQAITKDMYGMVNASGDSITGGIVHLGKRSCGWKFLWNPNIYEVRQGHTTKDGRWVRDESSMQSIYKLSKAGIQEFINRPDVEIYDEYSNRWDKTEFWEMTQNWDKQPDAWDGDTYEDFETKSGTTRPFTREFRSEYVHFLESLGFKLGKYCQDFYSDGLRFATCTEFC